MTCDTSNWNLSWLCLSSLKALSRCLIWNTSFRCHGRFYIAPHIFEFSRLSIDVTVVSMRSKDGCTAFGAFQFHDFHTIIWVVINWITDIIIKTLKVALWLLQFRSNSIKHTVTSTICLQLSSITKHASSFCSLPKNGFLISSNSLGLQILQILMHLSSPQTPMQTWPGDEGAKSLAPFKRLILKNDSSTF